ncbi:MAG: hypothetical protein ACJ749_08675 [Flavisolibacter sp.]
MNHELSNLDLYTLKAMYDHQEAELTSKLLSGALWNELKEERRKLTEIAIVMHKKAKVLSLNPEGFTSGLDKNPNVENSVVKPSSQFTNQSGLSS